jgi:hypothetical protein
MHQGRYNDDFIFHYTCSLKKNGILFLLRPVLFPGCYGHVYVFRILGVIMQVKNKII